MDKSTRLELGKTSELLRELIVSHQAMRITRAKPKLRPRVRTMRGTGYTDYTDGIEGSRDNASEGTSLSKTDTSAVRHCNHQGIFSHGPRCLAIQFKVGRIETPNLFVDCVYPSIVSECAIVEVRGHGIGIGSATRWDEDVGRECVSCRSGRRIWGILSSIEAIAGLSNTWAIMSSRDVDVEHELGWTRAYISNPFLVLNPINCHSRSHARGQSPGQNMRLRRRCRVVAQTRWQCLASRGVTRLGIYRLSIK